MVVTVTDQDGELLSATSVQQQALGSFFQENRGAWANTVGAGSINRKVASLGLEEDETFTVEVIAVPEYYTGQNAMTLEDILALKSSGSLKEGSFLTTTLTVDDTAPVVESITKDLFTGNLDCHRPGQPVHCSYSGFGPVGHQNLRQCPSGCHREGPAHLPPPSTWPVPSSAKPAW